jgi:hypothetical protein
MRGWSVPISGTTGATNDLYANLSNAEVADELGLPPNATGFSVTTNLSSSSTYIYIAIRRGPMKVPTSGTSVFSPLALNNSSGTTNTTGFPIDLQISAERSAVHATPVNDRLRGVVTTPADNTSSYLRTDSTAVEQPETITRYWNNTGFQTSLYSSGVSSIYWNFRRAPNFFDEVCFTAPTPSTTNLRVNHNLTVAPDLIIAKLRSGADDWWVYASTSALSTAGRSKYLILENTNAIGSSTDCWGTSNPTSTDFGVDTTFFFGAGTVVAYLFATCAGVSKVGSYTGTGALQTVNCGFTSGARFVLIKRTDSTGAWYVWDSARGITSGNDPYLLLNSTAAEITTTNYVDTDTTGFKVTAAAPAALNASGGTYIFLAVA